MATFVKRFSVVAVILGLFMALAMVNSTAPAHAETYYFQGTGDTHAPSPAEIGWSNGPVVNMSTDRGWKADFAPVHGDRTMDQTVQDAAVKGVNPIASDLAAGKQTKLRGFSIGGLAAEKTAGALNDRGANTSNLQVDTLASGYQPGTGALIVLNPYHDVLRPFGITTRSSSPMANQPRTNRCIRYDMVCDMVDPVKDPAGAATRIAGYLLYHGMDNSKDPTYNYGNLDNLKSTTTKRGNATVVMYDAPNPIDRVLGKAPTVAPAPAPVAAPAPAPEPAYVPPAPEPTYTAPAPQAPVYQAPAPVQQQVRQVWQQAAPVVQQIVPQQTVKDIKNVASQFGIKLP